VLLIACLSGVRPEFRFKGAERGLFSHVAYVALE
jgi:hypothetical protein